MADISFLIVYEDKDIIVIRKPAGLPVQHKSFAVQDLESMLKNYMDGVCPGVIHRLDQPVEGLLVFSKNRKAAAALNAGMQAGKIKKEYMVLAECREKNCASSGILTDYLLKDGRTNTSRAVPKGTQGAREARLSYNILPESSDVREEYKLLHVVLDTGRHHQIRVQLAHAGMPILGDRKYGHAAEEKNIYDGPLCLCAYRLSFDHPKTGNKMQFETVPEFLSDPAVRERVSRENKTISTGRDSGSPAAGQEAEHESGTN